MSLKVDTGVDLYTGMYHTGELEYDSSHVSFYFDGVKLQAPSVWSAQANSTWSGS